ncbi:MAG: hypothetical protein R2796_09920 [Chitinophagaceae bacterium]
MKFFKHIKSKQIVAGLLLAIMLFIQAEKTFHQHPQQSISIAEKGIHHFSQHAVCVICQYVFARDAVVPAHSIPQMSALHFKEGNTILPTAYIPTVISFTVSRGPPVC